MKKLTLLFIGLTAIIASCKNPKSTTNSDISLCLDWIPTMSFAGDIVAMNDFDSLSGINLKLHPAGEGIDPIKMVISGTDQIGVVGLDKLIMANEKGADLMAFAIIDNVTPTVFMSKKDKNITTPQDFIGKKIGIQSGGATEFVYRALIKKLNIDESKINEVQIGFDMKPFVDGQYDVRPGFIFDEAVYLDVNNIPYNLVEPIKFGLNYPGRVYFAKKKFVEKNPELIENFIRSVAQGWTFALNNPEKAIKQLQNYEPKINFERELKGLIKAKDYFSGFRGQILMPDTTSINQMVDVVFDLKVITSKPKPETYFTLKYVEQYHSK